MNGNIQVKFDESISGYVVKMPAFIRLSAIEEWKNKFSLELKSVPFSRKLILLIDTNTHEFESVQCLKSLRDFFTTNAVIQSHDVKIAFVQPKKYMTPHVKSDLEAYFERIEEAYKWLLE